MANLKELEAFRAVMLAGSVTGAAEMLRVTQPTISKLVAQLEKRNQVRLFDRNGGRLVVRLEARLLLTQVEKALLAVDDVARSARQISRGDVGRIRIVSVPPVALGLLPHAVAEFSKRRPDVHITIDIRGSSYIVDWLTTGQADIGFISGSPRIPGVTTERIYRSRALCVLPEGHALTPKTEIRPLDLATESFVGLGRETTFQHLVDRAFEDAAVIRRIGVRSGYSAMACAMVARGVGVTVVDPISAFNRHELGGVALRPFVPSIYYESSVLGATRVLHAQVTQELLAAVQKARRDLNGRIFSVLSGAAASIRQDPSSLRG